MNGTISLLEDPKRFPLIFSVSGHRQLASKDIKTTTVHLGNWLKAQATAVPSTPIWLLTALAEGADQLLATIALDLASNEGLPIGVQAILPMPQEEYEKDFAPEALKVFRDILERIRNQPSKLFGDAVIQPEWLPKDLSLNHKGRDELHYCPRNLPPPGALSDDKPNERDLQYRAVGRYVARHSHLLIALWDGDPASGIAGTGEVVRERLEGIPINHDEVSRVLRNDQVDAGPVLWVPTRRSNSDAGGTSGIQFIGKTKDGSVDLDSTSANRMKKSFEALCSKLENLNKDAGKFRNDDPALKESMYYLMEKHEDKVSRLLGKDPFRRWIHLYAVADVLALAGQSGSIHYRRLILGMSIAVPLADLLKGIIFPGLGELSTILTLAFPITYLVMYSLRYTGHAPHEKFSEYRSIAEALRVQIFWRISHIGESATDHYARRQYANLAWVSSTLRSISIVSPRHASEPSEAHHIDEQVTELSLVRDIWLQGQASYEKRRLARMKKYGKRWERISRGLMYLAVAGCSLSAFILIRTPNFHHDLVNRINGIFNLLPAFAACCAAYQFGMAYNEQKVDAHQASELHTRALNYLNRRADPSPEGRQQVQEHELATERNVIREVGIECLRANADWLAMQRGREPAANS